MSLLPQPRLVLATHNKGKIAEFDTLLAPLGVEIVTAEAANLPEPEETGTTFHENAALKAQAACDATGLPALADDSGLSVDALGGDPGVYSARWAGPAKDFSAAMGLVLKGLTDAGAVDPSTRGGEFVAVLALARPGEAPLFFPGITRGVIAPRPLGQNGFGYDPLFIPDEGDGRTFGEMNAEEKHGSHGGLSHRARAVNAFLAALKANAG